MRRPFHIPAGSTIRFGAPAHPLPEDVRHKIKDGLAAIHGIVEAHLPLCQVMGMMAEPAQILIIVVSDHCVASESVMQSVFDLVRFVIPPGQHLDVWPLGRGDSLLEAARKANCCLLIETS